MNTNELNARYEARINEIMDTITAARAGYGSWTIAATIDGTRYTVTTHDEDRADSITHQDDAPRYSLEEMATWFEESAAVSF